MDRSALTKLTASSFDDLLRQQNPFSGPDCCFDLRTIKFVSPGGLTLLAAACHSLHRMGRRPTIKLKGQSVASYLLRDDFPAVVRSVARFNPEYRKQAVRDYDRYYGGNQLLIELAKLEGGSELPPLLDRFVVVLRDELHYPKEAAYDVAVAVSEAGQNPFQHNSGAFGFIAMQTYSGREGAFLEIGVSDCGDGLAASLQRNPNTPPLQSDLASIIYATQLGTSEFDDPTRGRGLFHLMELAYKHAGSVHIRSGAAVARYRPDRSRAQMFAVPPMPGVHIALTLPALRRT